MGLGEERVLEGCMRELGAGGAVGPPPLFLDDRITVADHPERVFVEAEPDVHAVITDASIPVAHRSALAPEAPASLVDVNFIAALPGQMPGRGKASATAAHYRNFRWWGWWSFRLFILRLHSESFP